MKNSLALGIICILVLLGAGISRADVILSENFESGLPVSWTLIDSSGMESSPAGSDGVTWTDLNPGARDLSPYITGTFMICDSDNSGAGVTYRDYLVTPVINCTGYTGVSLQFGNNFRSGYGQRGRIEIRIGAGAWQTIASYAATTVFENTVIDISSYANNQSSVEIRWFYYDANYAWWWAIDNVIVTGSLVVGDDIAAVSIDNPSGPIFVGSAYTPRATVSNNGTSAQTFDVNLIVRNSAPAVIYNQTVTGISLEPSTSTTVTFSPDFTPTVADNYTFKATVINPGDQNTPNDSVLATYVAIVHFGAGGPDLFGNTWKDNTIPGGPTFNYTDISGTGTLVGNGDDNGFGPFAVGFSFPFYESEYTSFYVNTNGLVTLTALSSSRFNYCPVPGTGESFWIAPFWDDLNVRSTDGGAIYYQYFDAAVDYLVIQWNNFSAYGAYGDPMNMEAVLYSNGNILFQYSHINNLPKGRGQEATVGIQKDASDGLSYLCNDVPSGNELFSGLAIGWYPPVIDHDVAVVSVDSPTGPLIVAGAVCSPSATVANNGTGSETFNVYLEFRNSSSAIAFADTVEVTLPSGGSGSANFSNWTMAIPDDYTYSISTVLPGDANPNNNSINGSLRAVNAVSMPVSQDFEGAFPPAGWTVLDFSGTSTWTTTTDPFRSPTHSAQVSYDWLHNTNDWLVLAPIDMSSGSNISWLYYEEQSQWLTHGLRHSFYASTGIYFDPSAATPIAVHTPADHVIPGFSGDPTQFDLSSYAGNSHVWLAYRQENNQGPNTEYWWIDDVSIFNLPNSDVGIYSVDSPSGGVVENCDSPVQVTVKNYGLQAQSFDVRIAITGITGGLLYCDTATVTSLAPNSNQAVAFPNFIEVPADSYSVEASTLLSSDENNANNSMIGQFYSSATIMHSWDDNQDDGSITPYPFSNSMLAVKYTPLADRFTITGGNVMINQYSPDGNGYAEFEWVKICPDAGDSPDLANPFGTANNVGTYVVPIVIPIDVPDTLVRNYAGPIWIVAKYWDGADDFLSAATDTDRPDGNSFYSQGSDPAVWQPTPLSDIMMRIIAEYVPCGAPIGCDYIPGNINGSGPANGLDVVYGVVYFKGGNPPPTDCGGICPQPSPFFAAGDVNGSCSFNGIDITYFVNYLKGIYPQLLFCPTCPPGGMTPEVPALKPILSPAQKIGLGAGSIN